MKELKVCFMQFDAQLGRPASVTVAHREVNNPSTVAAKDHNTKLSPSLTHNASVSVQVIDANTQLLPVTATLWTHV